MKKTLQSVSSREALFLEIEGVCEICEKPVKFESKYDWLRDHFLCPICGSIPRERALMHVLKTFFPNYLALKIHESSPVMRGLSRKLLGER